MIYKVPLIFAPQPEGGFIVTSPVLPELVTEGDTLDEAFENAQDALAAVIEIYEDLGKQIPSALRVSGERETIWLETAVTIA